MAEPVTANSFGNDLKSFASGPNTHLTARYGESVTAPLRFLIWSALFQFVWNIVILTTVPGAILLLGLGSLVCAILAIVGKIEYFLSVWYLVWVVVDVALLTVTLIRGIYFHSAVWAIIACLIGYSVDAGQFILVRRVQAAKQ